MLNRVDYKKLLKGCWLRWVKLVGSPILPMFALLVTLLHNRVQMRRNHNNSWREEILGYIYIYIYIPRDALLFPVNFKSCLNHESKAF